MKYRIFKNYRTMQYEIEEDESGWMTLGAATTECKKLNSQTVQPEDAHSNAIHGIPSEKSLKNLPAKLAAIKRAEEIENDEND